MLSKKKWLSLKDVAGLLGRKPSSYLRMQLVASGQFEMRRVRAEGSRNPNMWRWEYTPIEGTWDDLEATKDA